MAADDLFGELGGLGGFSPETTFTGGAGGGGAGGFDLSSLFGGLGFKDILGGIGTAGGVGQQLMSILQTNRAPRTDREPFPAQQPLQSNQGPNPNQLRSILANKQTAGQSSGGVVSPASIAAIMGQGQSQIDPRLMQLIMQYTQQLQQV